MKKIFKPLVLVIITLTVVMGLVNASEKEPEQVTLAAVKDNTLYEDKDGALSNGAGNYFFVGQTREGLNRRGLLAFDLQGVVLPGSQISSVELVLYMSRTGAGSEPVSLHKVLAAWGEVSPHDDGRAANFPAAAAGRGEGDGEPAELGEATWLHTFYADQFWQNPGGDYVPTASATIAVNEVRAYTWDGPGLAADVQAWVDAPDTNFGWLLAGNEDASQTAKRFDSRENDVSERQPRLLITFLPPERVYLPVTLTK